MLGYGAAMWVTVMKVGVCRIYWGGHFMLGKGSYIKEGKSRHGR